MRIFVIADSVPFRKHGEVGVSAANIVVGALLQALRALGHVITLQCLFHPSRRAPSLSSAERREIEYLRADAVTVLPPFFSSPSALQGGTTPRFRSLQLLLSPAARLRHFYPSVRLREAMRARVRTADPHVLLTLWSPEGIAATHGITEVPRVAYHGDVDFIPTACQLRDRSLFAPQQSLSVLSRFDQRLRLFLFQQIHLTLMRPLTSILGVTACNSAYYAQHGHPRSHYLGNVWPDPGPDPAELALKRLSSQTGKLRIVGHMGALSQTGSTYGLQFLLREVLPRLPQVLPFPYEVHLIGGGEPVPPLRPLLKQEHVVLRGFVEDLDQELLLSDVFLLLNNAGPYQAAFTRHLVAWSLGLCLIVHGGSLRAIPEIRQRENALVGSTGEEIAQLIAQAATDRALNARVRRGGRETFEHHFTPTVIAGRIEEELRNIIH